MTGLPFAQTAWRRGPRPAPASPYPSRCECPVPVVCVVDPDASSCRALERLITRNDWRPLTFASADAFLAEPRVEAPCCLVLEAVLPGRSGIELQAMVANRTDLPVVFLAERGDPVTIVRAVKAGALDFLTKPYRREALVRILADGLERSREARAREEGENSLRGLYSSLSPREREVMTLVATGLRNRDVADELGISEITVKAHRGQVMRKMQA